MILIDRFKEPMDRGMLKFFFVLILFQFALALSLPLFLDLASTMQNISLWMWFVFGCYVLEVLTVPISVLVACLFVIDKFKRISKFRNAFVIGFFAALIFSWLYTLDVVFQWNVFLSYWTYTFFNSFILSLVSYIPLLIYVALTKILHVRGIGTAGMGLISELNVFISWPIWCGIFGMGVHCVAKKFKMKKGWT